MVRSEAADVTMAAPTPQDILNDSDIMQRYAAAAAERERFVERFSKTGKLVFYDIESRYAIGSSVADKIFNYEPVNTLIVLQHRGEGVKIACRSRCADAGLLMALAAKDIGRGGGHSTAGGAMIPTNQVRRFKHAVRKLHTQLTYDTKK